MKKIIKLIIKWQYKAIIAIIATVIQHNTVTTALTTMLPPILDPTYEDLPSPGLAHRVG